MGVFDGRFYRSREREPALPAVSLIFVQSRDGNTGANDPSTLGGGETDKHLIYEGLSRVDADAVMAGSTTAQADELVFSVWHPEIVRLRQALGRPRHPAQIVITDRAHMPFHRALIFNEPSLRVVIISGTAAAAGLRHALATKPWIEIIDAGTPLSMTRALQRLRRRGMQVISCVGGRRTATTLLREGLVDDLYLTTSPRPGGEAGTPFYDGPPLKTTLVVEKAGRGAEEGVRFQHFLVER